MDTTHTKMVEIIYTRWQNRVLKKYSSSILPLFIRKSLFINLIEGLLSRNEEIQYSLTEVIDFIERNHLDYHDFINALFMLRDQIMEHAGGYEQNDWDIDYALNSIQNIIVKLGSYFNYRRMDLNITKNKIHSVVSGKVSANILQLDNNFNIEKTNSSLFSIFGYEKTEVIGKPINKLFSTSSQALVNNVISQLKCNLRYKLELEVEAQTKTGYKFQALLKIAPLKNGNINPRYTAYIQDNTYIYETKNLLNLLSMAIENAGEGIFIIEPELPGLILYVNEAMEKMSGFSRHLLLGKPLRNLRNTNNSDNLEDKIVQQSLQTGWKGEISNYHKKGYQYIVNLHTQPVRDEYGNVAAIVGVERDITEQRRQAAKIRFLSKFPETNPNLVISVNADGNVEYFNPAVKNILNKLKLSEEGIKYLLPENINEVIAKCDNQKKPITELTHHYREVVFQYTVYQPSNEKRWYLYGTNITEKIELQHQLLQTERIRAVGEMAAGLAHDFNNLLATILGRTQLLQIKAQTPESSDELKIIEKAALDGSQIVRRLQEVTREKRDTSYVPLDVNELIKESVILTANKLKINTQLKGNKVQLQTDLEEPIIVKGNAVELKEVFTNLILNAYDAMPKGGNFYITTTIADNKRGEIKLKDTGHGMSEEIQNKIFNPFFTTKGEKGTGLGLSIAYKTIASHSGIIKVQSDKGKGSTFTIILPISDEPLHEVKRKKIKIQERHGEIRLLIVDDEPELLDTMAEILRLKYKSVDIAPDGETALNKIEENHYDVVLTDLGMPEMSGWELARCVKKSIPDSHIILVTGWGDQAREELKHHPYVDEILCKPYELKELIRMINGFFDNGK